MTMKYSGVSWIGDVPESWEMRKVSRSFTYIGSGTTPSVTDPSFHEEGTIPWINTGDLNDALVITSEKRLTEYAIQEHSTLRIYPPGTLIVAMYGATIGKIGILGIDACANQACCALNGSKYFDTRFVYFWFLDNRRNLVTLSYGGGQPNINQDIIRSLHIQCPSISEQNCISAYLDQQTAKIDHLMDLRRRQIALLKEQRAALIQQAVTRGLNPNVPMKDSGLPWLGEIPAHWEIKPLGTFASVKARLGWKGLKAEEYVDEGYIFLATPNLKGEEIDFDNVNYITKERYFESPEIMLREKDILMVKDGATLGIVTLVKYLPAPATVNGSSAVIRCYKNCDSEFLCYWLRSNSVQKLIDMMKGGMGVPHLFQSDIRRFPTAVPPLNEQNEIVLFIKDEALKIDALCAAYSHQITLLAEYRAALIHQCVTGRRAVPIPEEDKVPSPKEVTV